MTTVPSSVVYGILHSAAHLAALIPDENKRVYRVDEGYISMREALDLVDFNSNIKSRTEIELRSGDELVEALRACSESFRRLQEALC